MAYKKDKTYSDFIRDKFLKYSILLIIAMYIVFLLFMAIHILLITIQGTKTKNAEINQWLEQSFFAMESELETLSKNPIIINAIHGDQPDTQKSQELLYETSNKMPIANVFVLIDKKGNFISTNLYQSNRTIFSQNLKLAALQQRLAQNGGGVEYSVGEVPYGFEQKGGCTFGIRVGELDNRQNGYIFFTIKDIPLYEKLAPYHIDNVTITDKFDNIIYSTHLPPPDPMEKYPSGRLNLDPAHKHFAELGGISYFIEKTSFYNDKFQLYTFASMAYQSQLFSYGSLLLLLVAGLFVVLALFVLSNMAKSRLLEIDNLVNVAEHIGKGELGYRATQQNFSEFQVLSDALNLLSERLYQMIQDNEELAEHKRVMELKQMESQFNPHFVFNTLEALRYQIVLDPKVASNMVFKFATLMRYSIYYGTSLVPLKTDVAFLEDYLSLQKMRFGERLVYSIKIEPQLMELEFPKLLLQPVVENVMNHATKRKKYVELKITGIIKDNKVILKVSDTGDGMTQEELNNVRKLLSNEQLTSPHFGLHSVQRTIQLTYGKEYGLEIESEKDKGTTIRLLLPYKQEEESV